MSASGLDLKSASHLLGGREIKTSPDYLNLVTFGNQKALMPKGTNSARLDQTKMWQLDPVSFNAGSFTTNGIVFRVQPKFMKHIDQAFLELVCSETGGSNTVTPVVAPFLIDRIEIGLNSQTNPFQVIPAEHLYTKWQFYYTEQQNQLFAGNSLNMTTAAYAAETAIAAGGSATYVIPLSMTLFDKINPDVLKSDLIITVFPRASPISAGTGTLQLTNIRFRFHALENPLSDVTVSSLYAKFPSIIDYMNIVNVPFTAALSANTQIEIPLQGINGLCPAFFFVIRASKAAASSAIRTFTALGGTVETTGAIDFVNGNKVSLLGSGALSPSLIRYQLPALHTFGDQSSKLPVYWMYLNNSPVNSILTGKINGGVILTGREFLRLTPGTGFTSATYTVDIYFYIHSTLSLQNGVFKRIL